MLYKTNLISDKEMENEKKDVSDSTDKREMIDNSEKESIDSNKPEQKDSEVSHYKKEYDCANMKSAFENEIINEEPQKNTGIEEGNDLTDLQIMSQYDAQSIEKVIDKLKNKEENVSKIESLFKNETELLENFCDEFDKSNEKNKEDSKKKSFENYNKVYFQNDKIEFKEDAKLQTENKNFVDEKNNVKNKKILEEIEKQNEDDLKNQDYEEEKLNNLKNELLLLSSVLELNTNNEEEAFRIVKNQMDNLKKENNNSNDNFYSLNERELNNTEENFIRNNEEIQMYNNSINKETLKMIKENEYIEKVVKNSFSEVPRLQADIDNQRIEFFNNRKEEAFNKVFTKEEKNKNPKESENIINKKKVEEETTTTIENKIPPFECEISAMIEMQRRNKIFKPQMSSELENKLNSRRNVINEVKIIEEIEKIKPKEVEKIKSKKIEETKPKEIECIDQIDAKSSEIYFHEDKIYQNVHYSKLKNIGKKNHKDEKKNSVVDYTNVKAVKISDSKKEGAFNVNMIDLSALNKINVPLIQYQERRVPFEDFKEEIESFDEESESKNIYAETRKKTEERKAFMKKHQKGVMMHNLPSMVDVTYIEDQKKNKQPNIIKRFFLKIFGKNS
ncbi:hypothetical protein GVAV_003277 [Gurleya vavrai]